MNQPQKHQEMAFFLFAQYLEKPSRNRPFYSSRRHIGLEPRTHDNEAGVDPAVLSNSWYADISRSNALFNAISPFKMVL